MSFLVQPYNYNKKKSKPNAETVFGFLLEYGFIWLDGGITARYDTRKPEKFGINGGNCENL